MRAALAPPPKWKAYLASRARPRVKSFQEGGAAEPEFDPSEPGSFDKFVAQQQQQAPQQAAPPADDAEFDPSEPGSFDKFVAQQQAQQQQDTTGAVGSDGRPLPKLAKGLPGVLEAAGIGAATRLAPAAGAFAAGSAGAELGAAAGVPLAPFTAGLSVPALGLAGGIGGAIGGGALVDWLQNKFFGAVGAKPTIESYEQAAEKEHPTATFAGELGTNLLGFGRGAANLGERLISSGIQTGLEGVSEYRDKGTLDPTKLAMTAGVGALLAKQRPWLESAAGVVPGVAAARELTGRYASADTAASRLSDTFPRRAAPQPSAAEPAAAEATDNAQTPVQPDNPRGASATAVKPFEGTESTEMAGVRGPDADADIYDKAYREQGAPQRVPFGRRKTVPTVGDIAPDVDAAMQTASQRPAPSIWDQARNITPSEPGGSTTGNVRPEITDAIRAKIDPEGFAQNRGGQIWRDRGLLQGRQPDVPAIWGGSTEARTPVRTSVAGEQPTAAPGEPPYWEKPPTAAEYAHGDDDIGHLTIKRGQDVTGSVASDPTDPNKISIGANVPPTVQVSGKPIDPAYPLAVREHARRTFTDRLAQQGADPRQAGAIANTAGDMAERMWLESRGYNHDQFKAAIGETQGQRGFAPAPETTGATPAPPPPSPVEGSALAALAARQNAPPGRARRAIPPGEAQAMADLAARQQAPTGITEAPRPGPPGAPPEQEPPPRPQPQPPAPAPAPPPPRPAPPAPPPEAPPRATFGRRQAPPPAAAETTGAIPEPPSTPPAQAAAVARDAEQVAKTAEPQPGVIRQFMKDTRGTVGAGGQDMTFPEAFKMLTSQGGAFGEKVKQLRERVAPAKEGYRTQKAGSEAQQYAYDLQDRTTQINQQRVNDRIEHQKQVAEMKGDDRKMIAPSVQDQLYRAHEAGGIGKLSERVQAFYNKVEKPIADRIRDNYTKALALTKGWTEEARQEVLGNLNPNYLHRMAKGYNPEWDQLVEGASADPVTGFVRGMRTEPNMMQSRKFLALEDEAGNRTIVSPIDKENVTLWKGGNDTTAKIEGKFQVGEDVKVDGKDYKLADALTPEIEKNARFADGRMAEYHKNLHMSLVEADVKMRDALRNIEFMNEVKNNPKFQRLSAPVGSEAARRQGFEESAHPQFRGIAMDKYLKYALDNYARPGIQSDWFDGIRKASQAVTKTLFFTPVPHALNAFWHWWVGRGWDWLKPTEWGHLMPELMSAFRSVVTQDAFQQAIRDAGGSTVTGGLLTQDFTRNMGKAMQLDMARNPTKWTKLAETMGLGKQAEALKNLHDGLYNWSSKSMWQTNDILLTHQIMVNMRKGMDLKTAIGHAEQHIPNYQMPLTIMNSRRLAQVLSDPSLVAFGRYHAGVFNSLSRITRGLVAGDMEQRKEAAGNLFALALFAGFMKPVVLDPMVQMLTGNKESETKPRGPLAPLNTIADIAKGTKGLEALDTETITPSPLLNWFSQLFLNRDFAGHPIRTQGAPWQVQAAQTAEQIGRAYSPFSIIAAAQNRYPGLTPGETALRALGEQAADVKTPTPMADIKRDKALKREEDYRKKHPQGPLEAWVRGLM